jgi:N-acetylglucosaminyldiphosphoundecaprenol N-acetyl-beta-D-mannosaminyltransferase
VTQDLTMSLTASACTPSSESLAWVHLGNVRLSRVTMDQALAWIAAHVDLNPFRLVVTPNVDHVIHLQHNADFRAAYEMASLSLADGRPLQWAARYLGLAPLEKVSGSDLSPRLCQLGAAHGWRFFFVGGRSADELGDCLRRIAERYPGLTVGGACPPFGFERDAAESEKLSSEILAFRPHLLLFGCGSPKSEVWMAQHAERLTRGVGISCGAGIRFLAGLERRAPRWMQRAGLEWFWRMSLDPRRLWKRYLVDDMKFFPLVWQWKREQKTKIGE